MKWTNGRETVEPRDGKEEDAYRRAGYVPVEGEVLPLDFETPNLDVSIDTLTTRTITRHDMAVVMITTDRKPSYFAETVRGLVRSEGGAQFDGLAWGAFVDADHNPAKNAARALEWGSQQGRDWVLFLEDDLKFCARFIDSVAAWLTEHTSDDAPLIVASSPLYLFGSATVAANNTPVYGGNSSWALVPLDGFYGTQAFAMRASHAVALADSLRVSKDPVGQYDLSIVSWVQRTFPNVGKLIASVPSFVQHVGEQSSIRPGGEHFMFPSWPGEEWTALKRATPSIEGPTESNECMHGVNYQYPCADCDAYFEAETERGREPESAGDSAVAISGKCNPCEGCGLPSGPFVPGPTPVFTASRRVRASDFRSDWLRTLAEEMDEPLKMHRKLWEYAAIAQVYAERIESLGLLGGTPDRYGRRPRVLGFGVGRDPLASWFASRGAEVVATDKPAETTAEEWKATGQHADGKDQLRRTKAATNEDWNRVSFYAADMNNVLVDWKNSVEAGSVFDLTWSCGSFEHIGGLAASLDFFVRQMACLRPGGIAVHTTEYSLHHNLYDTPGLCLLRRSDIARLAGRLAEQGDLLLPFDPDGGDEPADLYVDQLPYPGNMLAGIEPINPIPQASGYGFGVVGPWHLSLALPNSQYTTTSIVLIAIRDGIRLERERKEHTFDVGEVVRVGTLVTQMTVEKSDQDVTRCAWFEGSKLHRVAVETSTLRRVHIESVPRLPSVLFLGDAVAPTGFAKSTHAVCDYLYAHSWNVRVCAMNYYGQLLDTTKSYFYPIHPAFDPVSGYGSPDGATLLPRLIYDHKPDVVVIQQDPWNITPYLAAIDSAFSSVGRQVPPIVGFLAVDSANQSSAPTLNRLAHVATWTQFGADELRKGGYRGPLSIVPLGVDTDTFKPLDRAAIRAEFVAQVARKSHLAEGIDLTTAFIVGYVGRNQIRKRLDLLIQYFAEFAHDRSNVLLYLYVGAVTEQAFDLRSLVHYWGVDGKVIVGYGDPTHPVDDAYMCRLYNLFDVFATATQGEGWWLPGFEAAACGVPIVAPDYSAIGELFRGDVATLVPCTQTVATAPAGAAMHTLGGLTDMRRFVTALRVACDDNRTGVAYTDSLRSIARRFPWSETGHKFEAMLREVLGLEARREG